MDNALCTLHIGKELRHISRSFCDEFETLLGGLQKIFPEIKLEENAAITNLELK